MKINNITVTIYYLSDWPYTNHKMGPKQEGNFYINVNKFGAWIRLVPVSPSLICFEFCWAGPLLQLTAEVRQWRGGQHGMRGTDVTVSVSSSITQVQTYWGSCQGPWVIASDRKGPIGHTPKIEKAQLVTHQMPEMEGSLLRSKRRSQPRFSFTDLCSVGEKCHKEPRPPGGLDGEWVPEAADQSQWSSWIRRPLAVPLQLSLSLSATSGTALP